MQKAIFSTVINPDHTLDTWVDWHLNKQGFDKIYLYLDDFSDRNSPYIPICDRLEIFEGAKTPLHRYKDENSNTMSRQVLNGDRAIELAVADKIDWILHIDTDELFYSQDEKWMEDSTVGAYRFVNHEALPLWESHDFFKDCQYFKVNGKHKWFTHYSNGKSAARVVAGLEPMGCHAFTGFTGVERWLTSPCILHYPAATYKRWLRKYSIMGEIGTHYFDNPEYPITVKFNEISRGVYRRCVDRNEWIEAEVFFKGLIPSDINLMRGLTDGSITKFKLFT